MKFKDVFLFTCVFIWLPFKVSKLERCYGLTIELSNSLSITNDYGSLHKEISVIISQAEVSLAVPTRTKVTLHQLHRIHLWCGLWNFPRLSVHGPTTMVTVFFMETMKLIHQRTSKKPKVLVPVWISTTCKAEAEVSQVQAQCQQLNRTLSHIKKWKELRTEFSGKVRSSILIVHLILYYFWLGTIKIFVVQSLRQIFHSHPKTLQPERGKIGWWGNDAS